MGIPLELHIGFLFFLNRVIVVGNFPELSFLYYLP